MILLSAMYKASPLGLIATARSDSSDYSSQTLPSDGSKTSSVAGADPGFSERGV